MFELEEQASRFEKDLDEKCFELEQLKQCMGRMRRDSSNWQQRHADTIISLDCFRASLRCLREEQVLNFFNFYYEKF